MQTMISKPTAPQTGATISKRLRASSIVGLGLGISVPVPVDPSVLIRNDAEYSLEV